MYTAGAENVDVCMCAIHQYYFVTAVGNPRTIDRSLLQIILRDIPAALKEEFPLSLPFLLQLPSDRGQLLSLDIVQHDDVRARIDGLVCLRLRADLHLEKQAKAADLASGLDGGRDRACSQSFVLGVHQDVQA